VKPRYVDCGNESSMEQKFLGAKVPRHFRSRERKFSGAMELSFPGAKVRGNESSIIPCHVPDLKEKVNSCILAITYNL